MEVTRAKQILKLSGYSLHTFAEFSINLPSAQAQLAFDLLDGQAIDAAVSQHGVDARGVPVRGRLRAQPLDAVKQCAAEVLRMRQPIAWAVPGPKRRERVILKVGVVVKMKQRCAYHLDERICFILWLILQYIFFRHSRTLDS
ncbi:hypothetical protein CLDAP_23170 [Caldilinea aerophila DSM 14535 = NBRC 104270]|uniref:Uncharacterized protein n=1 Tax=Caldilinea aerophila (strain DSM 14535 / JCM 11387 / NBRC 104270 / STL-6-O1) TaxID=926550 RepID=I0I519_CALAS|nr:hypothetical protein CLDAP_23170 [Caldilinea aerophila DSM 14535 = NBRC 104270]